MSKNNAIDKTKLQKARESEGLNRSQLARLADVSTRTVARLERRTGNVSIEMKHKILKAFNSLSDRLMEYALEDLYDKEDIEVG